MTARIPRPPAAAVSIARRLEEAGHETWAVGGAIRDALLGLPPGDWDLSTGARPEEVRRLFPRTAPIGIEHGTVGVVGGDGELYEVTTFRRDVETHGRHAVVEFADTVDEDLSRRDFTINAIAWHPLREELRDPFGGVADLAAGVIRTVGDPERRFAEDYLRVLRALRFAGHFDFTVEVRTWSALCAAAERLPGLSAERIREELLKVLSGSERPSASLGLYGASGVLAVLYPELDGLVGRPATGEEGGDVWSRAVMAADRVRRTRPLLRLAAVLAVPADVARSLLERLRFSNAEVREVSELVGARGEPFPDEGDGAAVRRWIATVGRERVRDLVRLWVAEARAARGRGKADPVPVRRRWRRIREALGAGPPLRVEELAIGGDELIELGLSPGPRFGEILGELLERVLERPELNRRDALLDIVREELAPEEGRT